MRYPRRHAIGTMMTAIVLVAVLAVGVGSAYYAYDMRTSGGVSHSGFTETLTKSTSQLNVPKGDVLVVIPPGVTNGSGLAFQPLDFKVQLGVNNTLFFYNEDSVEHIVESLQWPTGTPGWDLFIIQGKTATVQLNATGVYAYNFELSPEPLDGNVTVVGP